MEVKNLSFSYKNKRVLENISTSLKDGVYGLLGANGVGKTTFFKLLLGELEPESGEIIMDSGHKGGVSYLPQEFKGYSEMTVKEFLCYMANLKKRNKNTRKEIEEKADIFNLRDCLNKRMDKISGGQLRRTGLAQAFLFDPSIILLDEPSTGLDVNERINLRKYISMISKNKIIIISTHIVSDLNGIANKIFMLRNGKFILEGGEEEIISKAKKNVYLCSTTSAECVSRLENNYIVSNIFQDGHMYTVKFISEEDLTGQYEKVKPTLEDVYLMNYKEI